MFIGRVIMFISVHRELDIVPLVFLESISSSLVWFVSEKLLKLRGRWKTDAAKDMYVEESLDNRLQVTKYLRLSFCYAVSSDICSSKLYRYVSIQASR